MSDLESKNYVWLDHPFSGLYGGCDDVIYQEQMLNYLEEKYKEGYELVNYNTDINGLVPLSKWLFKKRPSNSVRFINDKE